MTAVFRLAVYVLLFLVEQPGPLNELEFVLQFFVVNQILDAAFQTEDCHSVFDLIPEQNDALGDDVLGFSREFEV